MNLSIEEDIKRIERGLCAARDAVSKYTSGKIEATLKSGGDPVTEADTELDRVLKQELVRDGDGWLSEETADDLIRLNKSRVWIVDPIDGTREFVQGIDEWCISVALSVDGRIEAGGICNPARNEVYLGTMESGVTLNGEPVKVSDKTGLYGATVLASRSEVNRGEWDSFMQGPFEVIAMGSVAYKLARVSAGLNDATFTLVPKNEWDYAAGTMLVNAAGGQAVSKEGESLTFNCPNTLISGLFASGSQLLKHIKDFAG